MARGKPETRNSAYLGAFASRDATPQVIGRSRKILGHREGNATDRALSLEQTEEHIAEGEAHIRRQRKLIDWLENRGHDTALAKEVLAIFEMMQTHHVTERERLLKEKSTYLGTYIFGEKARGHLRRAEGRLDLLAEQLNAVQVQLGIARDVIAECQSSVGLIEDVLKALDVLRRANTEAVSGGEDSTEPAVFPADMRREAE